MVALIAEARPLPDLGYPVPDSGGASSLSGIFAERGEPLDPYANGEVEVGPLVWDGCTRVDVRILRVSADDATVLGFGLYATDGSLPDSSMFAPVPASMYVEGAVGTRPFAGGAPPLGFFITVDGSRFDTDPSRDADAMARGADDPSFHVIVYRSGDPSTVYLAWNDGWQDGTAGVDYDLDFDDLVVAVSCVGGTLQPPDAGVDPGVDGGMVPATDSGLRVDGGMRMEGGTRAEGVAGTPRGAGGCAVAAPGARPRN